MSTSSNRVLSIYKSRKTILEILDYQDYNVSEYDKFTINEIDAMNTNDQLDMLIQHTSDARKIYIKYYLAKALRPNNLQEMIDDLFTVEEILTKNDTLFVIVKDEVNETLINTLKHIWESEKIFIILVPLERLQFNILDHVLVPPHRVLTESEKIEIKSRYNINNDNEFPELSRFDPVAQAIGIRPGEVCEINRPSKTAISANYYRICI